MLHYAEPTGSSTIVPMTPVPCSQPQAHTTEPLPARAYPQASTDWTTDGDFGCLRYKGKKGAIRIPGVLWMGCDAAFAQGFWRGRALMCQHEDGDWFVLPDQEFTHLIAQELPASLPAVAIAPWKRGFIFGWCMTWYYQPFLDEEAERSEEERALPHGSGGKARLPPFHRTPTPSGHVSSRQAIHSARFPGRPLFQKARCTVGLRASMLFRTRLANTWLT